MYCNKVLLCALVLLTCAAAFDLEFENEQFENEEPPLTSGEICVQGRGRLNCVDAIRSKIENEKRVLLKKHRKIASKKKLVKKKISPRRPSVKNIFINIKPIYPYGRYPKDRYPKGRYPNEKYPKEKYPNEKYPSERDPNERYPNDKYPNEKYPNEKYPKEKYPSERDPNEKYPNEQYPKEKYPSERDPNERYPNEKYPNEKYPIEKYPSERDPNERYPKEGYPPKEFPTPEFSTKEITMPPIPSAKTTIQPGGNIFVNFISEDDSNSSADSGMNWSK
ncbi:unnamed protein product, partial [Iphiclides podalirius]